MKRTITLALGLVIGVGLMAQEVMLTYENHGFIPGKDNDMKLGEYVEPGPAGRDIVWDLSGIEKNKEFTGTILSTREITPLKSLSEADVVLNEFGTKFFFKVDNRTMELSGIESASGNVYTKYDKPFVKMKYPFSYGDHYSGTYSGTKHYTNRAIPLNGSYDVSAEGYGKLILPGDREYMALRVKTVQRYTMEFSNMVEYEIVSYRWYINSERYPLAVVQTINSTTASGNTSSVKRAAYKYPAVVNQAALAELNLYPNPVRENMTVEYTVTDDADVMIELFDKAGKKIATLVDLPHAKGTYTFDLQAGNYGLSEGSYIIRTTIGDTVATKNFIKQ